MILGKKQQRKVGRKGCVSSFLANYQKKKIKTGTNNTTTEEEEEHQYQSGKEEIVFRDLKNLVAERCKQEEEKEEVYSLH